MKKFLVPFIIGIFLFGFGCTLFCLEIGQFDYIDQAYPTAEVVTYQRTYSLASKKPYQMTLLRGTSKIIIDNTLEDTMEITVHYSSQYYRMIPQEQENFDKIDLYYVFQETSSDCEKAEIFHMIVDNLHNHQLYNYEKTFINLVEIRISEKNLQYLKVERED